MTGRPAPSGPRLDLDVVVSRRDFRVEAAFSLEEGERLALYGTSGAGKSTILEAVAGGVPLEAGRVAVDGRLVHDRGRARRLGHRGKGSPRRRPSPPSPLVVAPRDRMISLVRQPTTLFPHLSVLRNVSYGRALPIEAARMLAATGLAGFEHLPASGLSGGQRQRVALARALGRGFRVLLLDEPFSAVDVAARQGLRELAEARVAESGAAALLVTHELTEAQAFGHSLAVIDNGRILQHGDPHALVLNPASRRVAELCGYTAFLPAGPGECWALHPDRFAPGEHPDLGPVLRGTVAAVQGYGPRYACDVRVCLPGKDALLVQVRVDSPPVVGTEYGATAIRPPRVASVAAGEH